MTKIDDLLIKYPSARKTTAKIFNDCDRTPTINIKFIKHINNEKK